MRGTLRFLASGTALAALLAGGYGVIREAAAQDATAAPIPLVSDEAPASTQPAAVQTITAPAAVQSAPAAVAATVTPTVRIRAGTHPDFDRVVFDWPRPVEHSLSREGNRVTLRFAAPALARPVGLSVLTRLRDFRAGLDSNGNLAASFDVAPQAKVRDFLSGTSLAVDIESDAASKPAPISKAVSAAVEAPAPVAKAAPPARVDAPVPTPRPAAKAPVKDVVETKAKDAPKGADSRPLPPATPDASLPAASAPAGTATLAVTPPAVSPPVVASAAKTDAPDLAVALGDTPLLVATLDPHAPVRVVIWQRAGIGSIVFDRKLTLSLDALTQGQEAPKVALTPFDLPKASGFRFAMPDQAELRAASDGTAWKIYLTRQQSDLPVSTALVPQPDFALGARFILPLSHPPEAVRMTDPAVGDDLFLLPLEQTEAFSVERRMADFLILPAAQGLVIKPLVDRLVVRPVSDGVEITAEGGLHLSATTDTGASQDSPEKARAQAAGKSIFDLTGWRGKPEENFTHARQRYQQTVIDVPDRERVRARMELARFYFARGYGEEAAALLSLLAKQAPDLQAHADFLALSGAAKILAYHPLEGLQDLAKAGIEGQPEIELWKAVGLAELRQWSEAEQHFNASESVLAGYPDPFYSRFTVLAVESALAAGKSEEGAEWLKRFAEKPHSDNAQAAIDYLGGVVQAEAGKADLAEEKWRAAAASHDRLYKVRAELALIDLGVASKSLTPAQAADRLEALRFGWRGDDLEVDILHRLGDFYVEARNIKTGFAVLSQAVRLYPNSPMTPDIRTEMSKTFHDVFLADLGKKLSPLDALALYQQYRNLMPSGNEGVEVTRNLAERLVAIDLLDQAGDLLDDLIKSKLQGEEKARTGSRLAAIRLLDHKPDAAMTALDASAVDALPAALQNERLLLRAKALADNHKEDDALTLLKDNTAQPAKLLRADVLMRAQRWPEAAKALLDLAGPPPKAGTPLQPEQADELVNTAIALSLAGDQTGLDRLAIDYEAAMNGTPQADTFRILTHPEKTSQLKDVAAVQSRIADVDMFQSFLNNYRKGDGGAKAK